MKKTVSGKVIFYMNEHTVHCTVTDCVYNDSNKCTSSAINIGGEDASKNVQTRCDSFSTNKGFFSSMMSSSDHTGNTKIKCDSVTCLHNNDYACGLDSIKVECTCDSCNCASSGETYCTSFDRA